jgi:YfiH family protein
MIYKDSRGIYSISSFAGLGVTAAYSCRALGDMRMASGRDTFLRLVRSESKELIMARQIHGVRVALVSGDDCGKTLSETDGLVYRKDGGSVVLGVSYADCVPLLAVDTDAAVIGVAHAGWRGTLNGIAGELVRTMVSAGCTAGTIRVSIGPHIGMCCYNVQEERAMIFQQQFGTDEKIAVRTEGAWHLDIGYVNYIQLLRAGITGKHIDAPVTCTSCQVAQFNSFRKDTKKTFGVQLGIIRF